MGEQAFYVSQLCEMARICGLNLELTLQQETDTIRQTRQFFLDRAKCWVLMIDDDVIPAPGSIAALMKHFQGCDHPWVVGAKCDVANYRAYGDFSTQRHQKWAGSTNLFYAPNVREQEVVILDTGFCAIHASKARSMGVHFWKLGDTAINSGGEDNLFGLELCHKTRKKGLFIPSAVAYHLDKSPDQRMFTEHSARCHSILLAAKSRGIPDEMLREVFPWIKRN